MITRAAATVRQPILVCRKSINLTDFTNNKMTFYIVLIGLFELLNIILYKVVKEHAKETPKERICVVPTRRKPKPNKSGHSPVPLVGTYCRLSAHIAACRHILPLVGTYSLLRFLRAFAKRQALISSLPSHPYRARFYCLTLTCVLTSTVGFVQPLSPPCISFAVWR